MTPIKPENRPGVPVIRDTRRFVFRSYDSTV